MRLAASLLPFALALTCAFTAHADWPMARHDHLRTSTGDGSSSIDTPAAGWRYYLGGSLGREQYLTYDVDGDGRTEVLFLMGGALLAKTPTDAVVWETEALDLTRIDGLHDLDGDGSPELIASALAGRLHVIRPTDGTVLWSLPSAVVGNMGNVRFADFDGDSVLDLYFAEAACGSTGALGDVAEAYTFAADLTAPTRLFALERGRRDYICGGNDTIVDIDGDGALEVVTQGRSYFYIYSAVDGAFESASEDVGSIPYGQATTVAADVDGDGRVELVCFTENSYAPPVNSRRVFLMGWDTTSGTLVKRWERSVADTLNDRHDFGPTGVFDLLGDGTTEVVTSFFAGSTGRWTTMVLAGADGTDLDTVPVGPFRGLVDLDADGSPEVITGDETAGLSAFRYTTTGLERAFTAPSVAPVLVRDEPSHRTQSARARALGVDMDGDGDLELIGLRYSGGRATRLVALSAATDPPTEVAGLDVGPSVSFLSFEPFDTVTRPGPQLVVARSDGYMWVLDDRLQPTNAGTSGEITLRGLRIGGFYSGSNGFGPVPVAGDLDGDGAAEVLARDSRGVLLRLGPAGATLVEPPTTAWELPNAILPTIVELTGDATPEIAVGVRADPFNVIRAVRASDASTVWERTVGTGSRSLAYDLVAGDVSGDGTPDLAFELSEQSGGTVVINVLSGTDGAPLWATEFETVVAGSGLGASALVDRDGNGRLDVLACPRNLLWWLADVDGSSQGNADGGYPGHPVLHDVDGDSQLEILAAGGVYGARALEQDLTPIWSDTGGLHTRVMGAVASCASGPRYVQAHFASARLTMWSASDGTVLSDIALRNGRRYADPSGAPEGPGVLGNVTVSPDLTGAGRPSVLVPSTDGFLYAIDPCTSDLDWALDFRFPVGEAILADTDGDGEDEIVVTVADGYLYGIDREVLARPLFVVENDGTGPASGPGDDIDEIVTRDTLWANWASVEGATSYEYAVITPGGTFLTEPDFIGVGNVTEVEATGLPLSAGQRYVFAVRAVGPDGSSSEQLSDGVLVLADPCDMCRADQICVAGECLPDPCVGVTCPTGQLCSGGTCVNGSPDGGPLADGGVGADGGGPIVEDGGCCSVAPGAQRGSHRAAWLGALALVWLAWRRRSSRSARRVL
jgi:hypothetical protein